jgi:hypothetical protein
MDLGFTKKDIFLYLYLFIYSYVHTLFGPFLPPAPALSLSQGNIFKHWKKEQLFNK